MFWSVLWEDGARKGEWCSKGRNILLPLRKSWLNIWVEFILTITTGRKWFRKCSRFLLNNESTSFFLKYLSAEYTTVLVSILYLCYGFSRYAYLHYAFSRYVYLRYAYLRYASSRYAYLRYAFLRYAFLRYTFRVMPFTTQYAFLHFYWLHDT